jgi:hypothetical protein
MIRTNVAKEYWSYQGFVQSRAHGNFNLALNQFDCDAAANMAVAR